MTPEPTHANVNRIVDGETVSIAVRFVGWSLTPVTTILAKDDTLPARVTSVTLVDEDVNIYAIWGYDTNDSGGADILDDTFDIIYNANGGDAASLPNNQTGLLAGTHNLTMTPEPTHANVNRIVDGETVSIAVRFVGWSLTPVTTILAKDDTLPTRVTQATIVDEDVDIYAIWGYDTNDSGGADILDDTFDIIYNANGGDAASLPNNQTGLLAGIHNLIMTPEPTHANVNRIVDGETVSVAVRFVGWSLTPVTSILAKDDTLPTRVTQATIVDEDVNIYAIWGYDTNDSGIPDILEVIDLIVEVRDISGALITGASLSGVPGISSLSPGRFTVTAALISSVLTASADGFNSNTHTIVAGNAGRTVIITLSASDDNGGDDPAPNLVISKSANHPNGSYVVVHETITYTISVRNSGDASASNVAIQDMIPVGMTLVANSAVTRIGGVVNNSITPSISGRTLAWTIPSIAAGQTVEVSFQVTIDPLPTGVFERTFRNTAQVNSHNTNTVTLQTVGLVKNPDRMTVSLGETINWTLRGFHNPIAGPVTNFEIIDMPSVGLNFQSGSIPAFTNGAGITYDIRYRVAGDNTWHTHASNISASTAFTFSLPQPGDLHYIDIGLFFGDVPAGFGLGSEIIFTFVVNGVAPGTSLINRFAIRYNSTEIPGSTPDYPTVPPGGGTGPGTGMSAMPVSTSTVTPTIPFSAVHHAYLIGDANGSIRPHDNITRAEVATIFFRLITDEYRAEMWTQQNTFSDVNQSHWHNNAVSTMANAGVFTGMPDGSFQPNRAITRAEFAVAMTRFFEGLPMEGPNMFPDIEGHWAAREISAAARMGWITGFPGGTFAPDQAITRAEATAIINRVLGRLPRTAEDLLPGMVTWQDNADINAWFYLYIQEATNSNSYVMQADGIHKTWTELIPARDWRVLERPYSTPWSIIN